jgi:hypothetical protein
MNFTPPRKCKLEECHTLIESGRSDIEYCKRECQDKDRYRKNAEQEKRLNAIKSEIRKQDKILERHYRMSGSEKIPVSRLKNDGFQEGGYCYTVFEKKTNRWYRILSNYAYFYNQEDKTIQIYTADELRTS